MTTRLRGGERRPQVQMHGPWMDPSEALRSIDLLERAIRAIWRAHGAALADYLACVDPDSPRMQKPEDAVWSGRTVGRARGPEAADRDGRDRGR